MPVHGEWAPFVYGRTLEADFRVLVAPEDFTDDDVAWALARIRVSTRSAEALALGPRWSCFRSERFTLVGLTCRAADVSDDMTRDVFDRPLHVFLGLVTHERRPVPPACDVAAYRDLYDVVRRRWLEPPGHGGRERVAYGPWVWADALETGKYGTEEEGGGRDRSRLMPGEPWAWCDSPESRHGLWRAALASDRPVSVCLGIMRLSDAAGGLLDGATVCGLAGDPGLAGDLRFPGPGVRLAGPIEALNKPTPEAAMQSEAAVSCGPVSGIWTHLAHWAGSLIGTIARMLPTRAREFFRRKFPKTRNFLSLKSRAF